MNNIQLNAGEAVVQLLLLSSSPCYQFIVWLQTKGPNQIPDDQLAAPRVYDEPMRDAHGNKSGNDNFRSWRGKHIGDRRATKTNHRRARPDGI